jgi:DNA-binding protein YbaB
VAQKKGELDKELAATSFKGEAADGKVVASFKYVPVQNPMDPNPDYEVISIEFDDAYFEETSPEDLSAAVGDAYRTGVEVCNRAVMEKYATLTAELSDVFGGGKA